MEVRRNMKKIFIGLIFGIASLTLAISVEAQDSTSAPLSTDSILVQYEKLMGSLAEQLKQAQVDAIKIEGAIEVVKYLWEERRKTLRLRSGQGDK